MAHDHHHHREGISVTEDAPTYVASYEAHGHEGAVAVSCTLQPKDGCRIPFRSLVSALLGAAQALEGAGAFLGHLKAFAKTGADTAAVSITSLEVGPQLTGDEALVIDPGSKAEAVAIVVGLTPEQALPLFHLTFS